VPTSTENVCSPGRFGSPVFVSSGPRLTDAVEKSLFESSGLNFRGRWRGYISRYAHRGFDGVLVGSPGLFSRHLLPPYNLIRHRAWIGTRRCVIVVDENRTEIPKAPVDPRSAHVLPRHRKTFDRFQCCGTDALVLVESPTASRSGYDRQECL
jgi:hypothetical protein